MGSNPSLGMEWYQPLGKTPLFFAPYGGAAKLTYNVIEDDSVVARYDQSILKAGLNVGVNLGAFSDIRLGAYIGRLDANVEVGDPGLPSLSGQGDGGGASRGGTTGRTAPRSRLGAWP